mmetsp:Transcript_18071/g.31169  ORF Transcript_18071/g.31169 Transcript_18071/m.31169 type:complete len:205 (+) Transcript_18071:58-672(+)
MPAARHHDLFFKIVLVGDSGVGKSSLLLRFVANTFPAPQLSVGVDFKVRTVQVNDKVIKTQIWDPAGNERYRSITKAYYRGADAVVIVFDVTNEASFNSVGSWIKDIDEEGLEAIPKVLVGNKSDLGAVRVVSTKDAEAMAKRLGMQFFETSARTNSSVEDIFMTLVRSISSRPEVEKKSSIQLSKAGDDRSSNRTPTSSRCCS